MGKSKICILMLMGVLANGDMNRISMDALIDKNANPKADHFPLCIKDSCSLWVGESFAGSLHGEGRCGFKNS